MRERNLYVFRFGKDINTDFIISGRYKFAITDMQELAKHLFEDIRPGFFSQIKAVEPRKSIIVADENFGMGSSREQAPWVIKEAGIFCVIAKSFARIFYRNAFNIGLALVEADTDGVSESDIVDIDFSQGVIFNKTKVARIEFRPWNKFQLQLVENGGIVNYLNRYHDFKI
ncbi:MAG: 3-isopropylmalate dehydratase [Candidatus Omnitrophica bacterium]|nr:3-isopropylmalate dehydratase [Candidatus Omnitrophota bacterium]